MPSDDVTRLALGDVEFLATVDEQLVKENTLPKFAVEQGLPVSQLARSNVRSGNFNLILVDPVFPGPTRRQQKQALERLFDIKSSGEPVAYRGPLDTIPSVGIERITYRRDKKRNRFLAAVDWAEVRISTSVENVIVFQGRIDPATLQPRDPPTVDRGFIAMVPVQTTKKDAAGAEVTPKSKKSKNFWEQLWDWI